MVAVVDSGIDYTHPDLMANMFRNEADCNANGVDDDGNGYVDDCHGIDAGSNDSDPMDHFGHGTHVAGIIGAVGNNNVGVVGVNWNVRIMACKIMADDGSVNPLGWRADEVACLDYVADMKNRGVNIVAVNASYSDVWLDPGEFSAIDVLRQKGILFVASAGNEGTDNDLAPRYPANLFLPNIITVANTTSTDSLDSSSSFGRRTVHIGAPGAGILSTVPPGNTMVDPQACSPDGLYCFAGGTSMSAPFVTGVAALLKARDPSLDWRAIKNLILAGGDHVASLVDKTVTERRLNAYGALACSNSTVLSPLQPSSTQSSTGVGEPLDLAALHINCAQPSGNVQVSVDGGGDIVTLRDDGAGSDRAAGDGIYSGQFVPAYPGSYTLDFPGGKTTTTFALRNYQYAIVQPVYRNITGSSLDLAAGLTTCYTFSGFQIQFGGMPFSGFCVGGNGFVSLTGLYETLDNNSIPDHQVYNLVAPFWDQVAPEKGTTRNVYYALLGTAPDRELVLEWRNVGDYACSSTGGVTFQVMFSENKDDILFNYKDVTFGGSCGDADGGGSATVGIQVGQHTGTQYSFNTRSLSDGMSILWTTGSLSVSPSSLDFDSVLVGTTSAPKSVTLSNESGSTITSLSIAVSGPFAQSSNCGGSLAANASCKIDVTFTPTAAGSASGELTISSSASGGDQKVSLVGSGITPPIVTLSPTSLDFGDQKVGTSSSSKTVTLTNDGGKILSITGVTTSIADFTQSNNCGTSLDAGQSCTIEVAFKPTALDTRKGELTVSSNAESKTDTVSLSGVGTPNGILSPSPTSLDFGDQRVGTTSESKNVMLTNTGTSKLNITDILVDPPFAASKDCVGDLAVSASCSIQVTFAPTAAGSAATQLTVKSDAGGDVPHVDLTGRGVAPAVSLSPSTVDFGKQKAGTTSSAKSVTLSNTGTATLSNIKIEASATFTQESNCGATLAANANCSIQVTFKPTTAGPVDGQLTVTSDADGSPHHVDLTGEGTEPVVNLSTRSLDFGQIDVGSTSAPKPVTLKNDGGAPLTIAGISTTGDFTKTEDCGASLDAGQSCTINVTFKPTATGTRSGQLTIASDASSSPDVVSLKGEGQIGVVSLSPTSLDFGNQAVGTESLPKNVSLTNTGTATLNDIKIETNLPFSQTSTCGTSLAASASCTIQVSFKPTAQGTVTGQLTVTSDASGSPHSVILSGKGTSGNMSFSVSTLDFGKQLVSTPSQQKLVTVTNVGDAPVTVSKVQFQNGGGHFYLNGQDCENRSPIPAGGECSVGMEFRPTATGMLTETLQVFSDAQGSPHNLALTGRGTDFSVGVASGSSNSASVNAGQSATYSLSVASIEEFEGGTTLSCRWNNPQPQSASCSVLPTTVNLDGTHAASVKVTVTTTARSMAPIVRGPNPTAPTSYQMLHLAMWLLALAALASLALRRRRVTMTLASMLLFAVLWSACGGGGATPTPTPTGTLPGTYSLSVSGASSTVTHSTNLSLEVK